MMKNKSPEEIEKFKEIIIEELTKLGIEALQLAYIYAVTKLKTGVDVTEKFNTALEQQLMVCKAYERGQYDTLMLFKEVREES